jgi:hypothetical protein
LHVITIQTLPQNSEFKRLIPLENIKIADISIILERSQRWVIDKIEVKMLGKNQNGLLNCHKQEFRDFGSNSLLFSHFNFLPPPPPPQ